MTFLRTLLDKSPQPSAPVLPSSLRETYDGDLYFPTTSRQRPLVIANFVSTLDGVVSYKIPGQSGGAAISGSDEADRFIMGLLRATADAIIVGAGTVRDVSPKHLWIPAFIYPKAKESYINYRVNVLHKIENPIVVVVSGSGRLELERAIFRTPGVRTVVITTPAGQEQLNRAEAIKSTTIEIRVVDGSGGSIDSLAILQLLHSQFGVEVLVHEGGPGLFGNFLAAGAVDELFLTISPQVAGRFPQTIRPGLVQSVEFLPDTAPWFQLLAVKQRAEHLYLRYRYVGIRLPSVV